MIKEAEVQNAYLLGRQAAMEKLAFGVNVEGMPTAPETPTPTDDPSAIMKALQAAGAGADDIRQAIGLGGRGLISDDSSLAAYDPRRLATMENLSRAGMLGGAIGGSALGGMDPRAAALASAGALGGGLTGGGLGQALAAGIQEFRDQKLDEEQQAALQRQLMAGGGALGGLGGGLGAGLMAR